MDDSTSHPGGEDRATTTEKRKTLVGERIDWFLQSQWFRDPQDLYLGNHICDGNDNVFGDDYVGGSLSFLVALLVSDVWQAPAGHPWMLHIGACGFPYTRFTPQTLEVMRTGCTGHLPTRITHALDDTTGLGATSSSEERDGGKQVTHFFAPIVQFSLLDKYGNETERMTMTIPPTPVDGHHHHQQQRHHTTTNTHRFSLKGHDYGRLDGRSQLSVIADPRCSYVLVRTTDWFGMAEQLVLGLLPLWIPAYHSTLVMLLCLQLWRYWTHYEIPSLWVTAKTRGAMIAFGLTLLSTMRRWVVFPSLGGGSDTTSGTFIMSSTSAIPDATRSFYIDLFLYSTAVAMCVVVNGMVVKLIVLLRLLHEVVRIIVCGRGRGTAPGIYERVCPICCRLRCQRCCASRISIFQSLLGTTSGIANVRRGRKRSDSDVMLSDDTFEDVRHAFSHGMKNAINGNVSTTSSSKNISTDDNHSASRSFSSCPTARFLMSTSFGLVLLFAQISIVLGVLIFSPMLLLMCGVFFMIVTSALSESRVSSRSSVVDGNNIGTGTDADGSRLPMMVENESLLESSRPFKGAGNAGIEKGRDYPIVRPASSSFSFSAIFLPEWLKNTMPIRLYYQVRSQFFDDRVSYELTCSQLYLSVLVTRAPSVMVAFLRFNPDHYLPLVFWDSVLVFPFLLHIALTVRRRDKALSRRWSLVPCIIALLTSVLGVLLYDRKMHRLPDLNVVLSLSLCLLHGRE